jgi:RNA recognition motif-containing protein
MNIYVGNINFKCTEEELKQFFEEYGAVASAKIIKDNVTGRSKGFGFVEMLNDEEGQAAIDNLNGKTLKEKELVINVARPKTTTGGNNNYKKDNYNRR